jgi:hypothetical protein
MKLEPFRRAMPVPHKRGARHASPSIQLQQALTQRRFAIGPDPAERLEVVAAQG